MPSIKVHRLAWDMDVIALHSIVSDLQGIGLHWLGLDCIGLHWIALDFVALDCI